MIKAYEELEFTDDFLFSKIMRDESICKELVEILLDIEVDKIDYLDSQSTINEDYLGHGIRFDVYLKDSNRIFDIELQTTNTDDLPLRSRYYQSMMDIDNLRKAQGYSELKESYVLFICTFDPFGKNLPVYHFETTCKSNSTIKLNDKTNKVFYNVNEYKQSKNKNVQAFLRYLATKNANSDFTKKLEKAVLTARRNEPWRVSYMTLQMKLNEAKIEGQKETKLQTAKKMLEDNLPIETIIKYTDLKKEEILAL